MKPVRTRLGVVFAAAAAAVLLASCSSSSAPADGSSSSAAGESAAPAATSGVTIAMVTHGDSGSFWSVVKKGAEAGAAASGVTLDYQESADDPVKQAQLIEAAVEAGVDGLAVSVPNPGAIKDAVKKATDAGIPVVTLNSGSTSFKELGAITHVGQDEKIAGAGAGEQLKAAGKSKLLCVIHEQGNQSLQDRCDGARGTFGTVEDLQVTGTADPAKTAGEIAAKLQADSSFDAVLTLNPDIAMSAVEALGTAGSSAALATFDLSGDVSQAIKDGKILFAVDQQQYLQGYLPVVFLALNKSNANTVGGGQPVLTGPGFVTKDNVEQVATLSAAGTR